jgi:hypothetical protein
MAFKKGQSGNPQGKVSGSGKIQPLRDALMEHVPAIIDSLVAAALAGDLQASKLLLERVFPSLKSIELPITIQLPDSSLTSKGEAILSSVSTGVIPPSTAQVLLNLLLAQSKLLEQDELITRIDDLEILMKEKFREK